MALRPSARATSGHRPPSAFDRWTARRRGRARRAGRGDDAGALARRPRLPARRPRSPRTSSRPPGWRWCGPARPSWTRWRSAAGSRRPPAARRGGWPSASGRGDPGRGRRAGPAAARERSAEASVVQPRRATHRLWAAVDAAVRAVPAAAAHRGLREPTRLHARSPPTWTCRSAASARPGAAAWPSCGP